MTCAGVRQALPLHVGGDLSVAGAAAVQGHLSRCSSCTQEWQVLKDAHADLLSLTPSSLSAGPSLWTAVEERLPALDALQRHQRPFWHRPWAWTSLAAATVLALLPALLPGEAPEDLANPSALLSAQASDQKILRQAPDGSALVPVPDEVLRDFLLNNGALMGDFPLESPRSLAQPSGLTRTDL